MGWEEGQEKRKKVHFLSISSSLYFSKQLQNMNFVFVMMVVVPVRDFKNALSHELLGEGKEGKESPPFRRSLEIPTTIQTPQLVV